MRRLKSETPTVSRICDDTIIELVYDAPARKTAFAVGRTGECSIVSEFKTATGEVLVPYAPDNNLIHHACVLLPSQPIPHGGKDQLLRDIEAYLHRYVDLSPVFERIAAHYVLLTWIYDAFQELPYLRFQGDLGSGKTRALMALGSVVQKGFFASAASSVSPIFHTLDAFGGTLILDEADLKHSGKTADLVKIFNNGTGKGLPVLRTLQNRHKEFNPAAFTVYGPKIVAMRGGFRDVALESRFLTERMGRRPLRDDIPIQTPVALKEEALGLRNRLLHFRLTNLFDIHADASRRVEGIAPRLNQTTLSLASLIDDPALLQAFEALLRARDLELGHARSRDIGPMAVRTLETAFADSHRPHLSLRALAGAMNEGRPGSPISPRSVGRVLRAYGIPLRKSNGDIVAVNAGYGTGF